MDNIIQYTPNQLEHKFSEFRRTHDKPCYRIGLMCEIKNGIMLVWFYATPLPTNDCKNMQAIVTHKYKVKTINV